MTDALASWRARFQPSRFVGQVTILATGASVAQLIGLAAAPVLTRLYDPADFGVYALYASILALASPLVSARYELAVVPAETDDEGLDLMVLAWLLALGAAALVALLLIGFRDLALRPLGLESLLPYWWLIPLGILLTGLQQAARYASIRQRRYARISGADITQAAVASGTQIALGANVLGPWGMLTGQLLGTLASTTTLATSARAAALDWRFRHSGSLVHRIRQAMSKYRGYPSYLPWGGLLDALGQRLPVLLLSGYYGPGMLGLYAVAERLLRAPASLLAQASSQVFFARMTETRVQAHLDRLLWRWAMGVTTLCVVPFLLLHFFGEPIFAFVLGERWRAAGTLAARLAPYIAATLVVSPISTLLLVAKRQGVLFLMQLLFCVGGFAALWLSHAMGYGAPEAVSAFALVQCAAYAVYFAVLLRVGAQLARAARAAP